MSAQPAAAAAAATLRPPTPDPGQQSTNTQQAATHSTMSVMRGPDEPDSVGDDRPPLTGVGADGHLHHS
jgi:hypothetical protein